MKKRKTKIKGMKSFKKWYNGIAKTRSCPSVKEREAAKKAWEENPPTMDKWGLQRAEARKIRREMVKAGTHPKEKWFRRG